MFNEKINYCINRIKESVNKNLILCDAFNQEIEEEMMFNSNIKNTYDLPQKCSVKRGLIGSKMLYDLIVIRELENITVFKRATDDLEKYLSPYGSLYCGNGILYYNDTLVNYSDEEFLQIILNHIIHYMHECVSNNRNGILIKSNILLAFYHLGVIEDKIIYAKKERSILYNKPEYHNIINDCIIFTPNKNYKQFVINYVDKTNFYTVDEDFIRGVNLIISESYITIPSYKSTIKDNMKLLNRTYDTESVNNFNVIYSEMNSIKQYVKNYIDSIVMPTYLRY